MINTVTGLIGQLKTLEYVLYLEGEKIRFKYAGQGEPPEAAKALLHILRDHKSEIVSFLKVAMPKPCMEADGGLVIPFESEPHYHWWKGGQGVKETIEEVRVWRH